MKPTDIEAISFDFFNTLVFHREGRGRGHAVMDYLRANGLEPAPWRHEVLYEIFDDHHRHYAPDAPVQERESYRVALAARLFGALGIGTSDGGSAEHAGALWRLLGPSCLGVFPDAPPALRRLRSAGYRLAIVSNWPCGLSNFCTELGLSPFFDHVLASAEVGAAKPDGAIFAEACTRLGVHPGRVLHVGDSLSDDYVGGEVSGLRTILIDRDSSSDPGPRRVIRSLGELVSKLRPRLPTG